MRITEVQTMVVDVPLKQPTIKDSQSSVAGVEFLQVRLETDAGVTGWGMNWNYTKGLTAAKQLIDEIFVAELVGSDPLNHRELCARLAHTCHFIGRVGIARVAEAAVNMGLWDIRCKEAGLPLWRLLGGADAPVKAYNTDGGWLGWTTEELIANAHRLRERGFDAVKIKIGLPDPGDDLERVAAVREAVGPDMELMLDVNTVWDLKTAKRWVGRFETLDVAWLEEPFHPFDRRAHAELARRTTIPLAVGETIYTLYDFRDYMDAGAVDIVQADVTKLSGIDEWLEVAHLAAAHGLEVVPHTNVQQKIHVQLAAATRNVPMVEFCYESIADIWEEPITVADGAYPLPQQPGVGVKLRDAVIEAHRIA